MDRLVLYPTKEFILFGQCFHISHPPAIITTEYIILQMNINHHIGISLAPFQKRFDLLKILRKTDALLLFFRGKSHMYHMFQQLFQAVIISIEII